MDLWQSSWQDIRFAGRVLWRDPVAALVALGTLSLTLGVTISAFALLRGGLWNLLPFPDSHRLIDVRIEQPGSSEGTPRVGLLDGPSFEAFKESGRSLSLLSAYRVGPVVLGPEVPEKVPAAFVTGDLFKALGVQPLLGRSLQERDSQAGGEPVVVLSFASWRRIFGGESSPVGRVVSVDGESRTVVGVMPEGFFFPEPEVRLWLPLILDHGGAPSDGHVGAEYFSVLGRLESGHGIGQAQAEGEAILQGFLLDAESALAIGAARGRLRLASFPSVMAATAKPGLIACFGIALFLVLIGGANLVALSLARHERRSSELQVRAALGASHGRLARQMITETAVLVGLGGLGGLAVASWLHHLLPHWLPVHLQRLSASRFDVVVVLFGLALSTLVGLVIALALILYWRRSELWHGIARTSLPSLRLRELLISGEVALAVVVVIGAALVLRGYADLVAVELGYNPDRVLTASMQLTETQVGKAPARAEILEAILGRMTADPEVQAAGAVSFLPLARGFSLMSLDIVGRASGVLAMPQWSSPGYQEAAGLELVEGRWFSEAEHHPNSSAVVVNQEFVRRYLGGAGAGKTLSFGPKQLRVIGTVRDMPSIDLTTAPRPVFFASFYLAPELEGSFPERLSLAFRTASKPERLVSKLRSLVSEIAPAVPLENVSTMEASLAETLAVPRFYGWLLGLFALTSLVLATGGVYGLLSFSVAQRRRELGIRKAMGAGRPEILKAVMVTGLRLVATGSALGLVAAVGWTVLLRRLVSHVPSLDAPTCLGAALLFLVSGALASAIPAWRASSVDATIELRQG